MEEEGLSKPLALVACASMAIFYVAMLYAPTMLLRLPPPSSFKQYMIRRFICAFISSLVSILLSAILLPIRTWKAFNLLPVYGIRTDHFWQAVVFPLSLTCLMYAGSLVHKSLHLLDSWILNSDRSISFHHITFVLQAIFAGLRSFLSNISTWRNYIVGPLTEELVFRACMIPLLFCGGFKTSNVVFLCPVFFSLAHLNHLMEVYYRENFNLIRAAMAVGLQLGYTVIFGSYASFLFIRTGHLLAPLVAHILCNFMGLPVFFSRSKGVVSFAFAAGLVAFIWLLFPLTRPELYNDETNDCRCWHGYCF